MGQLSVAEAFNPRRNSIDFLRWLLAFLVIFSHAGPLAGFYGGEDLGTQISKEQSLGGVAVAGFFFFSGFLITKSRMGRSTIWRYFWRRCLRIFPAFWAALAVTVTVFAPLAWHAKHGTFDGYWQAVTEAPRTYFLNNMFLELGQRNIAELGDTVPYFLDHQARDWNGSAWTLKYEFLCYIIVGLLGLFGALSSRFFATAFAATCIGLNFLQWSGAVNMAALNPIFADPYLLMFAAPFGFGMIFALYGEKIMVDDRVAFGMLAFGLFTYAFGGWNAIGQYGFEYFLMWFGIRVPITGWAKRGDFSYGIYIFAWPLMYLATFYQLERYGWFVYHATIVMLVHIMAFISWHVIEKPAMSLKNWTPKWLSATIAVWTPAAERVKRRIVAPNFSSTRFAEKIRKERAEQEERAGRAALEEHASQEGRGADGLEAQKGRGVDGRSDGPETQAGRAGQEASAAADGRSAGETPMTGQEHPATDGSALREEPTRGQASLAGQAATSGRASLAAQEPTAGSDATASQDPTASHVLAARSAGEPGPGGERR